jgi:hypothetical protein
MTKVLLGIILGGIIGFAINPLYSATATQGPYMVLPGPLSDGPTAADQKAYAVQLEKVINFHAKAGWKSILLALWVQSSIPVNKQKTP